MDLNFLSIYAHNKTQWSGDVFKVSVVFKHQIYCKSIKKIQIINFQILRNSLDSVFLNGHLRYFNLDYNFAWNKYSMALF